MIKIGIIDDHQILINGLTNIVEKDSEIKVVFQETKGLNVLSLEKLNSMDVLLLDIEMPEIDGFDLSKRILELDSEFKILILSMYNEKEIAQKLKDIGVRGFLSKNTAGEKLIETIKSINKGESYFNILRNNSNQISTENTKVLYKEKIKELSQRENEILKQIVKGLSNQQIGEKLFISHRTVDTHRSNIMKKLDVSNVASLVRVALKSGRYI
ncbi:MAG: response regulator [Flavobacteriales bacterium]